MKLESLFSRLAAFVLLLGIVPALLAQSLVLNPSAITLNAQTGTTTAVSQFFAVSSSGSSQLQFVAASLVTAGPSGWLDVNPKSGATPTNLTITANPAGLFANTYTGVIQVTTTTPPQTQFVTVSFTVAASPQLNVTPAALQFSYQLGGSVPPPTQTLTVGSSTGAAQSFTAVPSPSSSSWLLCSPSGTTPGSVTVFVSPASLAAGTYNSTVTITPALGSPVLVPVTLTVAASPQLTATPSTLSFNYQIAGTNPVTQKTIALSNPGSALGFTVSDVATITGGLWLTAAPTSGNTPGSGGSTNLAVQVNGAGLPAGVYQGTFRVNAPLASNASQVIGVTLNVSASPLVELQPTSLTFNYQLGGAAPASQTVTPTSTGPVLLSSTTADTKNTGSWLSLSSIGLTGSPITVSVNPAGLPVGTYPATVSVTAAGAANGAQTVSVTLNVTNNSALAASPASLTFNFQTGQLQPLPKTVTVSSGGTPVDLTVAADPSATWLLAAVTSGSTTPATVTVAASITGLTPAVYHGNVTVSPTAGTLDPVIIPVTLNVSTMPLLIASASSLAFNYRVGDQNPAVQSISITTTSDAVSFTISKPDSATWLNFGGTTGAASSVLPFSLFVGVNPATQAAGIQTANITLTPNNGSPAVVVAVTLTTTLGGLTVTPASLSFSQVSGGAAPSSQTLNTGSTGSALVYSILLPLGGNWLTVTPMSGSAPGVLTVSAAAGTLAAGTYQGSISIVSAGAANSPLTVPVTFIVLPAQTLALSPSSMTFNYSIGSVVPAAQQLSVTSTGGALNFTVAVPAVATWLKASAQSGATPLSAPLNISVDPTGLVVGTYTGTLTVSSPAAGNSPLTVSVTLNVAALPVPVLTTVSNAASFSPGPVAPGELVYLKGSNFGPSSITFFRLTSAGNWDTTLAETQVLFDGFPAPVYWVRANEAAVIVPYGVYGRVSTKIQVAYKGVVSAALEQFVAGSAPGIFTTNASGSGQGIVQNYPDYTLNTSANPAPRGSPVIIWATGEGQTSPGGTDGRVTPLDGSDLRRPLGEVSVTIGGKAVDPATLYGGSAPGSVEGVFYIVATIPADTPIGNQTVIITVGSANSPSTVTLAVK